MAFHELPEKRKEYDTIKVPQWRAQLRQCINDASGAPEHSSAWQQKVFAPGIGLRELQCSEPFVTLDQKLATALLTLSKGELEKRFLLVMDQLGKFQLNLKGRQMVHIILSEFAVSSGDNTFVGLQLPEKRDVHGRFGEIHFVMGCRRLVDR